MNTLISLLSCNWILRHQISHDYCMYCWHCLQCVQNPQFWLGKKDPDTRIVSNWTLDSFWTLDSVHRIHDLFSYIRVYPPWGEGRRKRGGVVPSFPPQAWQSQWKMCAEIYCFRPCHQHLASIYSTFLYIMYMYYNFSDICQTVLYRILIQCL